jgi:hypothetical protein
MTAFKTAGIREQEIRALAGDQYGSDEIEIDADARISEGDENGAFVRAWVWVDFSGTELDKG